MVYATLDGESYDRPIFLEQRLNYGPRWLGSPFEGTLRICHDEYRLLFGRREVRRRQVLDVVFVNGLSPYQFLCTTKEE